MSFCERHLPVLGLAMGVVVGVWLVGMLSIAVTPPPTPFPEEEGADDGYTPLPTRYVGTDDWA